MNPVVDIVVVPRERYVPGPTSLRALIDTVPADIRIIVVTGGAPTRITTELRRIADHRIEFVGPARHLAPNAARRIGLAHVTAPYVVFIDNDVIPSHGWLEPLVEMATERDVWAVGPLVAQNIRGRVTVHEAGGDCHIEEVDGMPRLAESQHEFGIELSLFEDRETRLVERFEFHCILFDVKHLRAIGGPSEAMCSQGDHLELALRVHAAGGTIMIEPRSVVVFQIPDKVLMSDLSFFLGRWSPKWNKASMIAMMKAHVVHEGIRSRRGRTPTSGASTPGFVICDGAGCCSRSSTATPLGGLPRCSTGLLAVTSLTLC